ncbi:UDP-Glc:alpha-D-GlcNAc-diphosphoundecaprenol beta-1,3-glucosyltransferase WfgD [compost metagenome]|uniref:glycosyltransferase family 2 protein n=1 Tax=Pedobacter ghigonis TaxID=2730403 RepID=UPI000FB4BBC9|nr:glycosyltransferase family 2 protein [Pedobacter ghigonis]
MISICIATYNGEKYIIDQIKSILNQINPNDEIIISDDSSTDGTITKIKSLKDSRIRILEGQKFYSPIYNFENCLKNASGNVIFLADQDDVWAPDKVKIMCEYLIDHDLVLSDCEVVNDKFETIIPSFFKFNNSKKGIIKNLYRNSYIGCCMAFNKEVLNKCLPFPKDLPMHDSYIGLVAELKFKVKFLPNILLFHRKHDKNTSDTSSGKSKFNFKEKIFFRLNLIKALLNIIIYD